MADKMYYANVESVQEQTVGGTYKQTATIVLDGQARTAYIPTQSRNVQAGDSVKVTKNGTWVVEEITTRHEPPEVAEASGSSPANANTVSASTSVPSSTASKTSGSIGWGGAGLPLRSPNSAPYDYTISYGSSLNTAIGDLQALVHELRTTMTSVANTISNLVSAYNSTVDRVNDVRSGLSSVNSALGTTINTVNSNATRLNQTRDYAAGMADSVNGVVDVLKNERIIQ